ncbi:histidine kinase dimerization/phospho-acceptor domain-containing protein [Dactylosporangium salmoneum]|uniref:histidine kinase n=1 Tax=Dactylosporangium salmoneum TaxID=53361 RepID=A0ABP5SFJ4_9ACTN
MQEDALRATVATAAHDLSNALGAVLNYATFIAEDLDGTEAAAQYLPHLQSAAQRALDLVSGLTAALAPDAQGD